MEGTPEKTLLDKPAVAPKLPETDFFNGLLGVMGQPEDLSAVERFIAHPSDLIQRAVLTCRFEIGQRKTEKGISED